ncbi:MAG: hypothetical protein HY672_03585 [Chloroflexi bacterium]|nr:hypothetical protein [Chloroflexota bacterium]
MAERPELTCETFLTLARQQGLEMDIPHLQGLFPEVQAMFQRIKLLDQVDTSGILPGPSFILTDTGAPE